MIYNATIACYDCLRNKNTNVSRKTLIEAEGKTRSEIALIFSGGQDLAYATARLRFPIMIERNPAGRLENNKVRSTMSRIQIRKRGQIAGP